MAERTARTERDRDLQRQGVSPEVAGRQAYRDLRTCDCTFAEANTVKPRQVRFWHAGTSDPLPRGPANRRLSRRQERAGTLDS